MSSSSASQDSGNSAQAQLKASQNKGSIFPSGWKQKDFGNHTYNTWRTAMIKTLEEKPDYDMGAPELLIYLTSNNFGIAGNRV